MCRFLYYDAFGGFFSLRPRDAGKPATWPFFLPAAASACHRRNSVRVCSRTVSLTSAARSPGALDKVLSAQAPLPDLPSDVTVGDPARMLKQRPDIRGAERRLASANAQIGEQTADLFPKVTLFGDISFNAATLGHLARKDNFTWVGVPYLQWNVLDFGRIRGAINAAEASRDEAEAKYAHTVLAALQDANTALSRYGHQREHLVRLRQVQGYAERSAARPSLLQGLRRPGLGRAQRRCGSPRRTEITRHDALSGKVSQVQVRQHAHCPHQPGAGLA
jgi:hypothetical protein